MAFFRNAEMLFISCKRHAFMGIGIISPALRVANKITRLDT